MSMTWDSGADPKDDCQTEHEWDLLIQRMKENDDRAWDLRQKAADNTLASVVVISLVAFAAAWAFLQMNW
jgi:hypothetical protein